MPSSYQVVLWKQESFVVLRPLHIEFFRNLLDCASQIRPDMLLAFKGSLVETRTLESLRALRIALYNYYPDTSPFAHDPFLARSIRAYDCVFYTKKFWGSKVPNGLEMRPMAFLPHGYDADVHKPLPLTYRDLEDYGHDVTVVASHTSHKEQLLSALVRAMPHLDLHIYGSRWVETSRSPELQTPHSWLSTLWLPIC